MRWFDEPKREPYTDSGIFIAYKEDGMPRDGWLKRQIENTERNIASWPRWMRIESGVAVSKLFLAAGGARADGRVLRHPERPRQPPLLGRPRPARASGRGRRSAPPGRRGA